MRYPVLLLALAPAQAMAASGSQVPEPSTLSLMALGVAGVLIGRRAARRSDDTDQDD